MPDWDFAAARRPWLGGGVLLSGTDPVDTAWRIHASLSESTGRVDAKASFAVSLESAVLAALIALYRGDVPGGTAAKVLFWIGALALALSALAAVSVVSPRLGSKDSGNWRDHFLYFGDLRHWNADDLSRKLRDTSALSSLTRQLVVMSEIAWIKHRRVQQSLVLAVIGSGLAALSWMVR
jgi:hypothetical protein